MQCTFGGAMEERKQQVGSGVRTGPLDSDVTQIDQIVHPRFFRATVVDRHIANSCVGSGVFTGPFRKRRNDGPVRTPDPTHLLGVNHPCQWTDKPNP